MNDIMPRTTAGRCFSADTLADIIFCELECSTARSAERNCSIVFWNDPPACCICCCICCICCWSFVVLLSAEAEELWRERMMIIQR